MTGVPPIDALTERGFAVLPSVVPMAECGDIDKVLAQPAADVAGSRCLLDCDWCAALTVQLRRAPALAGVLAGSVAVQCAYFDKNPAVNWIVPVHQDLSIPVKARIESDALTGWSVKEGGIYVQPPIDVLERLVAVRLHLDDNGPDNGPLRVVPGSHRLGRLPSGVQAAKRAELGEVECHVPRGGVLLMRPLLMHASSKATGQRPRRVLHFVYGPLTLPHGLEWARSV